MRRRICRLTILGLVMGLTAMLSSAGVADEAEENGPRSAMKRMAFIGTIVAAVPESRTLVVDVPLSNDVLRIGAQVTDTTRITADGQAMSLDRLQTGDRVRISVRRIALGNEAVSVEVLSGRHG